MIPDLGYQSEDLHREMIEYPVADVSCCQEQVALLFPSSTIVHNDACALQVCTNVVFTDPSAVQLVM